MDGRTFGHTFGHTPSQSCTCTLKSIKQISTFSYAAQGLYFFCLLFFPKIKLPLFWIMHTYIIHQLYNSIFHPRLVRFFFSHFLSSICCEMRGTSFKYFPVIGVEIVISPIEAESHLFSVSMAKAEVSQSDGWSYILSTSTPLAHSFLT